MEIQTDPITGAHSLNNMKFTTRNRDNDKWNTNNCAVDNVGNAGGWRNQCMFLHTTQSSVQYSNPLWSVALSSFY